MSCSKCNPYELNAANKSQAQSYSKLDIKIDKDERAATIMCIPVWRIESSTLFMFILY
jgi:hypothetical protein